MSGGQWRFATDPDPQVLVALQHVAALPDAALRELTSSLTLSFSSYP